MEFKNYKEEVKRTLPDLGSQLINSIHMTMGFSSESHEALIGVLKEDTVNIGEELCDKNWYACNYALINDISLDGFEFSKTEMPVSYPGLSKKNQEDAGAFGMILIFGGTLLDMDKKWLAYGKQRDMAHAKAMLIGLLTSIGNCALEVGIDMNTCMANNIAKLRLRFPDKFDANLAINRDHDAERVELEKQ